jgi:hypothetical protein
MIDRHKDERKGWIQSCWRMMTDNIWVAPGEKGDVGL